MGYVHLDKIAKLISILKRTFTTLLQIPKNLLQIIADKSIIFLT